jgi:hypothetical protein
VTQRDDVSWNEAIGSKDLSLPASPQYPAAMPSLRDSLAPT